VESDKVREQGQSLNQIFRENLKYILAVLFVWAITFPYVLQNKDNILAKFTLLYNSYFGYPNPRIAHQLMAKGDAILDGRGEGSSGFFGKFSSFFSGSDSMKANVLPLDLTLMEKSCLYYRSKEHVEEIFLEPTWREKAQEWNSPLFQKIRAVEPNEVSLGPNPKEYWNSHIEHVLEALDYYKRALRFSGPEFAVPKRIERVAWAVCRPAEILLAYKTHMLETEDYILNKLKAENKLPSNQSDKQQLITIMSSIKNGGFPEVNPNDYMETLLRQILLTGMKSFSPKEMDSVYERIIYMVAHSEKEYLKFVERRGDLYFQLGKENSEYYKKAINQYTISIDIKLALDDEMADVPLLLVHQFEATVAIARCYYELNENNSALKILDSLTPQLRNVDERSVGGIKFQVLKSYRETKRKVLRKLQRYEEADEIPLTE
jgi:hypothetical protein